MLRRSDFIEARYAFSFVFANFGIAIAARMPMITTTIRSSIRVKPLRVVLRMRVSLRMPEGVNVLGVALHDSRSRERQRADQWVELHVHPSPTTTCANGALRRNAKNGECF